MASNERFMKAMQATNAENKPAMERTKKSAEVELNCVQILQAMKEIQASATVSQAATQASCSSVQEKFGSFEQDERTQESQ